jgi:tRNA A-37 threonylcarbamoyl transferase component Bud32
VRDAIQHIKEKYGMDVSSSFNLAAVVCTPRFKESDLVGGPCEADENNTTAPGKQKDKLNFITPKQDEDFSGSTEARNPIMVEKLRRLFRDVVFLNNEGIVHGDIHDENVSWMGDHLVLHDWGRTYHGVRGMRKAIKERYFDRTHLQEVFDKCTIVLEEKPDDETLLRYMMFFDIVNMTYELLKNSTPRVQHTDLDTFIEYLNKVWDSKVSGDELRLKILMGVNILFPQGQAAPPAPVPVPVPAPPPQPAPLPPPPAPVEDKKTTDIKNACRALLGAAGGTRRRRHRRTRKRIGRKMKGGVFLGAGTGAMVFASTRGWDFIPAPVGSIPPPPPGLGPEDIVAHVTKTDDDVIEKNALVQGVGTADPYVKMMTNPSIGAYDVRTDTFLGTFVRAQENLISGSSAKKLYKEWSAGVQPPLTCSLMLRYNKFTKGDVLSLVDLMIGLVHINGRFVHCDLNDSNMGIMSDGCPVITDYDRVQTDSMRLSMYIERYILGNTGAYPWFADIEEIYGNMGATTEEEALQFLGQLTKIVDLLTVVWFVEETHPELSAITREFRDGIKANWKTVTQEGLHGAVSDLGQRIVMTAIGKTWRPMSMDAERAMAAEYNTRSGPARNTPGRWAATRNHYRFGVS